jgi:hypothetical protein
VARTILLWLAAVFLGGMVLLALTGDRAARRQLPAQLLVGITIGATFFAGYWYKVRPRRALHRAEAGSLNLASAPGDALGMFGRSFALLDHAASAKDIENTSWGTWRGLDVVVFDYWFARSGDLQRDDYEYFTCASTPVPQAWPDLAIVPHRLASRLASSVGLPGVEFELERFNRSFEVRSSDRRFASALIDASMMEWLLALPTGTGFEILGGTLLAQTPRSPDRDVAWALETMATFKDRIPPVVASLFGR